MILTLGTEGAPHPRVRGFFFFGEMLRTGFGPRASLRWRSRNLHLGARLVDCLNDFCVIKHTRGRTRRFNTRCQSASSKSDGANMFVGHYGVSFAAKPIEKRITSVGLVHRCAMAGCDLVDPCADGDREAAYCPWLH
jgi:hypothetical protein